MATQDPSIPASDEKSNEPFGGAKPPNRADTWKRIKIDSDYDALYLEEYLAEGTFGHVIKSRLTPHDETGVELVGVVKISRTNRGRSLETCAQDLENEMYIYFQFNVQEDQRLHDCIPRNVFLLRDYINAAPPDSDFSLSRILFMEFLMPCTKYVGFSLSRLLEFAKESLLALEAFHSLATHCDLKPENIMVRAGLGGGIQVVLADMGSAFLLSERQDVLEESGGQQQDFRYASPALWQGGYPPFVEDLRVCCVNHTKIDDVFSLVASWIAMACGRTCGGESIPLLPWYSADGMQLVTDNIHYRWALRRRKINSARDDGDLRLANLIKTKGHGQENVRDAIAEAMEATYRIVTNLCMVDSMEVRGENDRWESADKQWLKQTGQGLGRILKFDASGEIRKSVRDIQAVYDASHRQNDPPYAQLRTILNEVDLEKLEYDETEDMKDSVEIEPNHAAFIHERRLGYLLYSLRTYKHYDEIDPERKPKRRLSESRNADESWSVHEMLDM